MASACSPRANRIGPMPLDAVTSDPPRGPAMAPVRSGKGSIGPPAGGACAKRLRGAACLVETVIYQSTGRGPVAPRPPHLPAVPPPEDDPACGITQV